MNPENSIHSYKLLARCGRGAYGNVYIAQDTVGRRFALKTIEKSAAVDREVAGLQHYVRGSSSENLIRIFHIEETPDFLYYTMELADDLNPGNEDPEHYIPATLDNIMARKKHLMPEEVLKIAAELLHGLADLHANDLVHRDIKPENILIVNGVTKLSDIGLVRNINQTITLGGTLGFIPPERLRNGESKQTMEDDLYAVGKVLYCLLTGYPPDSYPQIPADLITLPGAQELNNIITIACSRNPRLRFKSAGEFANALARGRISLQKKAILWSGLLKKILAALILAALGGWTAVTVPNWYKAYLSLRQQKENKDALTIRKNSEFFTRITNSASLKIQLKKWMTPQEFQDFFQKIQSMTVLPPAKSEAVRLEASRQLEAKARLAASAIPESSGNFMEDMKRSGEARILPNSILGDFLPAKEKENYLNRLADWEKRTLLPLWRGKLAPGKTFVGDDIRWQVYAYIPPGEFDSVYTGDRRKVEYPIWVSEKEILAEDFTLIALYEPNKMHGSVNHPAVYITWNDVLHYCRRRTQLMAQFGQLPPGYIIRPLTDTEWEWSLRGAWQDTAPRKIGTPNHMGIFKLKECDEYVLNSDLQIQPPSTLQLMRYAVGKGSWQKIDHYFFQGFYFKSAFRTAIAPGDMSYFEKNFRWETPPQNFDAAGRHFELVSSIISTEKRENMQSFCRLAGGEMAVTDQPEIKQALRKFPCAYGWPVQVAGEFQDGAWRWPDGRAIPGVPPHKENSTSIFSLQSGNFIHYPHVTGPAFLCQWSLQSWQDRLTRENRWDHPMVRKLFSIDKRRFAVIAFQCNITNFQTLVRLLGGTPVSPHPGKFREELFAQLADIPAPVVIGGHFYFDRWLMFDRSVAGAAQDISPAGKIYCQSPYMHTLAVYQKKFCRTQAGPYFLIEIPGDPRKGSL